jgi:hypothetical protein
MKTYHTLMDKLLARLPAEQKETAGFDVS